MKKSVNNPASSFRAFCVMAALHTVVCAVVVLLAYANGPAFQVEIFRDYADKLAAGLVPYADFPHEYPPTSLAILLLPRLLTDDPTLYAGLFSLQILVCDLVILYLLSRLGPKPVLLYGVGMLLFWRVPFIRHDLVPVMVATLGAFAVLRGRFVLAAVLWGFGGALKLYPIVAAPVLAFGATLGQTFARWSVAWAVFLVGLLWGLVAFGPDSLMFLTYHADRPAQVESIPGNIQFFLPNPEVVNTYGSFNVVGPGGGALVSAFTFVQFGLVLLGLAVAYLQWRGASDHELRVAMLRGAMLATFAFSVFGKVLAWHYFFWPLPLMAMVYGLYGFRHPRLVWGLYFAAIALTTVINEAYRTLEDALPAFVAMLTVRDLLVLPVFFLMLLRPGAPVEDPGDKPD
ncbi:glycosyltransferase 87 family protein [Rubrobacter indicoceani]|uniref:glycosyltransferase 87 family protein n=1 Tax=Rubrobacter indicoceani TaxID=2051957 RepID=UPI001F09988A|nr:glycosyltransferase 87 family protein [Rubrobacter indicoceani]